VTANSRSTPPPAARAPQKPAQPLFAGQPDDVVAVKLAPPLVETSTPVLVPTWIAAASQATPATRTPFAVSCQTCWNEAPPFVDANSVS
jgi:hypothetical protein